MDVNQAIQDLRWPAVVVICLGLFFWLFRTPIGALIARIRRLGYGDKAIDLGETLPPAAEQQKKLDAPKPPEPVPTVGPPPPASAPVTAIETELEESSKRANLSTDLQIKWLMRTVALFRLARSHEIVYRLITGSQIGLLLQANTALPPNLSQAQQMYDSAKATHPEMYRDFSFETWHNYPINTGLLTRDTLRGEQILRITPLGQDFLRYLIDNNLTSPKAG
jgi:hypothetical protein